MKANCIIRTLKKGGPLGKVGPSRKGGTLSERVGSSGKTKSGTLSEKWDPVGKVGPCRKSGDSVGKVGTLRKVGPSPKGGILLERAGSSGKSGTLSEKRRKTGFNFSDRSHFSDLPKLAQNPSRLRMVESLY